MNHDMVHFSPTPLDDELDFAALASDDHVWKVDDFDFAAMLAEMNWADTRGCLDTFDTYRDAYVAAARRAGKRNPAAAWYNAINTPLFQLRKLLQFRIAALTLSEEEFATVTAAADAAARVAAGVAGGQRPPVAVVRELKAQLAEAAALISRTGDHATRWKAAHTWCAAAVKGSWGDVGVLTAVSDDVGERAAYACDAEEDTLGRMRVSLDYVTEMLFMFNHGLALTYARKFTSNTSRQDTDDMHAAASLGLMRAIATYDPDLGLFGSWAFKPVQRDTLKAVRDVDFTNMTHGDFERRPVILRAYEKLLEADPDSQPSFEDVAAEAGVTVDLVSRVLAAPHVDSLHTPVGEDGATEFGDLIADRATPVEDTVISSLEVDALREYGLPVLEPKERYIIVRRFGLHGEPPDALSDIGKDLGLSRESVRQNANKALARLLHPMVLAAIVRGSVK